MSLTIVGNSNWKRIWLAAFLLGFSAGVWLAVESNWVSALNAVAKLGFGVRGFGGVTIKLLVAAFAWSIGLYFAFKMLLGVPVDLRSIPKFASGVIVDLLLVSLIGFVAESWLLAHDFLGMPVATLLGVSLAVLKIGIAALIAKLSFFQRGRLLTEYCVLESFLLGLWGLIAVTTLALLLFPRLTIQS
jgi:hypothetical protein